MIDHGFIAQLAGIARQKGVSGYPGNGWSAVHVTGAARMTRLGREHAAARFQACMRSPSSRCRPAASPWRSARAFDLPIASIAPEQVQDHFGWIGQFFAMDMTATSIKTRELLDFALTGPELIKDIDTGAYAVDAVRIAG